MRGPQSGTRVSKTDTRAGANNMCTARDTSARFQRR